MQGKQRKSVTRHPRNHSIPLIVYRPGRQLPHQRRLVLIETESQQLGPSISFSNLSAPRQRVLIGRPLSCYGWKAGNARRTTTGCQRCQPVSLNQPASQNQPVSRCQRCQPVNPDQPKRGPPPFQLRAQLQRRHPRTYSTRDRFSFSAYLKPTLKLHRPFIP